MNERIVILGTGLAGITLARELRKLNPTQEVVMVTRDDGGFYSKPSLSNAMAAGKNAAQLLLTPAGTLASQLKIQILARTMAESVHVDSCTIKTSAGEIAYSQLILALGANQIHLPIRGDGAREIQTVNNLSDYGKFRQQLDDKKHVAIIGAGLIGCEFANDLRTTGIDVSVFNISASPLGRLLPPKAAAFLRSRLENFGIGFKFSTSIAKIDRQGGGYLITDSNGNSYPVDLVLSATGLTPNLEVVQATPIKTIRGIVVDRHLRTSVSNVYALGDCAEVNGLVLPYVLPIMHAARALAKTLLGEPTDVAYPAMPIAIKTPACPAVVCPPPNGGQGFWQEHVDTGGVRSIYSDPEGKVLGFALLGDKTKEKAALTTQVPAWL